MQSNCVSCSTLFSILTDTDEASLRLIYRDASSLTEWIILRGIDPLSLSVRCVKGLAIIISLRCLPSGRLPLSLHDSSIRASSESTMTDVAQDYCSAGSLQRTYCPLPSGRGAAGGCTHTQDECSPHYSIMQNRLTTARDKELTSLDTKVFESSFSQSS